MKTDRTEYYAQYHKKNLLRKKMKQASMYVSPPPSKIVTVRTIEKDKLDMEIRWGRIKQFVNL